MNHSSEQQGKRRDRGEQFQQEIRLSWSLVPQSWRLRIADGRGSSRPADELVLLDGCNLLLELKRTTYAGFKLSFMRTNQIKGLLDFERAVPNNRGLVLVSIINDDHDTTLAFRLSQVMKWMQERGQEHVKLEDFYTGQIPFIHLFLHEDYSHLPEGERIYDMRRLQDRWKSL